MAFLSKHKWIVYSLRKIDPEQGMHDPCKSNPRGRGHQMAGRHNQYIHKLLVDARKDREAAMQCDSMVGRAIYSRGRTTQYHVSLLFHLNFLPPIWFRKQQTNPATATPTSQKPHHDKMKTITTLRCIAMLSVLLSISVNAAPTIQKRNACTFDPDPDCLPGFTMTKTNATVGAALRYLHHQLMAVLGRPFVKLTHQQYDELRPWSLIGTYNNLTYTGFRAAAQLGPASPQYRPHLLPTSGEMMARAYRSSTVANSTRITSAGTIMKFKSFSFGCQAHARPEPVPCNLVVSAYNPGGDLSTPVDSLQLKYEPDVLPYGPQEGDACLETVDEAMLSMLRPANYYVFATSTTSEVQSYQKEEPRLVLDDIDAVIYQFFYGGT